MAENPRLGIALCPGEDKTSEEKKIKGTEIRKQQQKFHNAAFLIGANCIHLLSGACSVSGHAWV